MIGHLTRLLQLIEALSPAPSKQSSSFDTCIAVAGVTKGLRTAAASTRFELLLLSYVTRCFSGSHNVV